MFWIRNDGPYDVWRGTVDGSGSDYIYYFFEITDGADRDYYNALGMWSDQPPHGDFLVNLTSLGSFPLGATADGNGAVFRVWAPNADSAAVVGSFNNWNMNADPLTNIQGFWQGKVSSVSNNAEYKYVFQNDGDLWRTDPRALAQVNSVGNSLFKNSQYVWNDSEWVTPYFEDMVIYELHVGSFSGERANTRLASAPIRWALDPVLHPKPPSCRCLNRFPAGRPYPSRHRPPESIQAV